MKFSQLLAPTLRETPADADLASHKLMLKSGMIRKVASGVYEYLPLGFKVLNKVERIVREEMNRTGAQEVKLPIIQPSELWKESGRWEDFGPEMFKLTDRKDSDFTLGPTHEEVITDLVCDEVNSYKELPFTLYQINDKFRDEIRPRFGVMRSREFYMKDAYSFHENEDSLKQTYRDMYDAYARIFDRCGLEWKAVEAPTGVMGGKFSQEFMALAEDGGEDIALCPDCDYAANVEIAEFARNERELASDEELKELQRVETPGKKTVQDVADYLDVEDSDIVKTFIYEKCDDEYIAVLVRGDHELQETKLMATLGTENLKLISAEEKIRDITGADFGSIGPINLDLPIIADSSLEGQANFVVGANEDGYHYKNVNWGREISSLEFADIRSAEPGDQCPDCQAELEFRQGIEVGQLFQLGTKYSRSLEAEFQNKEGQLRPMIMGCYGIGVSRVISAVIEQYHHGQQIAWPAQLVPFDLEILVLQGGEERPMELGEQVYQHLIERGYDVLLDDRDHSPGEKFNDADLLGAPLRLIIGPRGLSRGIVELESLDDRQTELALDNGLDPLIKTISRQIDQL